MTNPQRKKGTAAESALMHDLAVLTGRDFRRTSAGTRWDIESINNGTATYIVRILATRPDRGRWLLTMTPGDWTQGYEDVEIRVEVKRYKSFSIHKLWEEKFRG